jgi:hypothetical protein
MESQIVKVVVPSYKRAEAIRVLSVVPQGILCVPDSQEAQYREHNREAEIVTHPDTVVGLARKRQWISEHFGSVLMLDDDVTAFYRLYRDSGALTPIRVDRETTWAMIQETARMAKDLGAFLFGFSSVSDQRNYRPQTPFKLSGYVNGCAFGLLAGSKVFFHPESVAVEDYFGSLINAYHHRTAFIDTRFAFGQYKTFKNPGGLSEFRSLESEERDLKFLRRMFGEVVQQKKANRGTLSHEFERTIRLPF